MHTASGHLPGMMGKFLYRACLVWYVFKLTTLSMMKRSLWKFSDCKTEYHKLILHKTNTLYFVMGADQVVWTTLKIFSSSAADISLGTDDTPVSRLAKTLSDPATDEAMVARLSAIKSIR